MFGVIFNYMVLFMLSLQLKIGHWVLHRFFKTPSGYLWCSLLIFRPTYSTEHGFPDDRPYVALLHLFTRYQWVKRKSLTWWGRPGKGGFHWNTENWPLAMPQALHWASPPYILEMLDISSPPCWSLISLHLSQFESSLLVIIKDQMLRISPQMFPHNHS